MLLYTYIHFVDICANLVRGFEYRYLVVDYLCCSNKHNHLLVRFGKVLRGKVRLSGTM